MKVLLIACSVLALVSSQHVAAPCPFNRMCSCKMMRPTTTSLTGEMAQSANQNQSVDQAIEVTSQVDDDDDADQDSGGDHKRQSDIGDVSCLGVPFALLPALPAGRMNHVDIVNSGLEVVDATWQHNSTINRKIRIESLRLMSNRIRHVADQTFSTMTHELKSLDLSYNELDELPSKALRYLRALDWANFHSNRLASLDGFGQLWTHLSPTLHALFVGNNDITSLPRSQFHGESSEQHHSLSSLEQLNWLNVDGNQLTEISGESLPPRLHTLSAAHNRIQTLPLKAVDQLKDLRWLDLRGNDIRQLPVVSGPTAGWKIRLDKLDLGENLISSLPQNGFNKSIQVRDLYLDFNRISHLPDSAFRGSSVARLYLSSNGIQSIDDRAFHSLSTTLVLLDLERNQLSEYPPALDHLKRLRFLYLANNQLSQLMSPSLASFGAHLEGLSLAGNDLQHVPVSSLKHCPKMAHLNLAYNRIADVGATMFQGWASNLQVLILKGNQLSQLPSRLFRHCANLKELSLSFNRISNYTKDSLLDLAESLENLELNMISSNDVNGVGGGVGGVNNPWRVTDLLQPLRNLQWLSLEHNQISAIASHSFDHLNQLRYLSLEGNRLERIDVALFKGHQLRYLRDVRLSYNALDSIVAKTFHGLHELTTIVLSHNSITTVHHAAFDHLPKLMTINLASNRIRRVERQSFRRLGSLLHVDLQFNKLKEWLWSAFANCTHPLMPAHLNVSHNSIGVVRPSSPDHLSGADGKSDAWRDVADAATPPVPLYLKMIDFSHNQLTEFPDLTPLNAVSLKKLYLAWNRIQKLEDGVLLANQCGGLQLVDLSHNHVHDIQPLSFRGADQLQVVDLSHNQLETLPPALWSGLKTLRIVDLSVNKVRQLARDLFEDTSLETINLSHNLLAVLPVHSLTAVAHTLRYLDVSHNHIEHLDAIMLAKMPNLISLNLAHNRLNLLPDNVFSYLSNLLTLDLSSNTIRANFKELFHYMQKIKELNLASTGLSRWPHLPLPHLISLNLSSNGLTYRAQQAGAADNAVIKLDRLRSLDLSRNRLTIVPNFLWSTTPLLKELDLSSNPIRLLSRDAFSGLQRLKKLNLQPLHVLESVESDTFHGLFYLQDLKIQTWPGSTLHQLFNGLGGLKKISVEIKSTVLSNQMNDIGTLDAAPKLADITIFGQQLRNILPNAFSSVGTHTLPECSLAIKHSSLRQLPERLISGLEGCASLTLDLRMNQLQTLTSQSIRSNNSLSISSTRHLTGGLLLEHNPWTCSCDNAWLGHWLKRWYLETSSMRHPISNQALSLATCRGRDAQTHARLIDLSPSENVCSVAALSSTASAIHSAPFPLLATMIAVAAVAAAAALYRQPDA